MHSYFISLTMSLSHTLSALFSFFVASLKKRFHKSSQRSTHTTKLTHTYTIHAFNDSNFFTLENGYWSVTVDAQIHITMCPCHTHCLSVFSNVHSICDHRFSGSLHSGMNVFRHSSSFLTFRLYKTITHIQNIHSHTYMYFCRFSDKSWFEIYACTWESVCRLYSLSLFYKARVS